MRSCRSPQLALEQALETPRATKAPPWETGALGDPGRSGQRCLHSQTAWGEAVDAVTANDPL